MNSKLLLAIILGASLILSTGCSSSSAINDFFGIEMPPSEVDYFRIVGYTETSGISYQSTRNMNPDLFAWAGIENRNVRIQITNNSDEPVEINYNKDQYLLIEKNGNEFVLNKGDLLEYEFIAKSWDKVGSIESDGALVLRLVNPPYMNPQTDRLEGVVDVIFIVDENCGSECVDSEKTAQTMKNQFKLVFGTSRTVKSDSEEGKGLIDKYDINKLNSFVMSDEAQKYPGLMLVWNQTGRIADDGSLILG